MQCGFQFARPATEIRIELREEAAEAILTVTNEGPRIPDFAEGRIFERFYSLPRPDTDRRSTGLGLPFVKQVAELHGGAIDLENVAWEGAAGVTARLRLPRA